ncbi:hypothetical protein ACLUEY_02490 [Vreelandella aquamarina]
MAHQVSLSFSGVKSVEHVNQITTALMMVDGVESAEVGQYGAEVEGRVKRDTLIAAVSALKLGIKVS